MVDEISYRDAGVDIDQADRAKAKMKEIMAVQDPRVLNSVGAFATLLDGRFPELEQPVLVTKTEEPGTKQKLAAQWGCLPSLCFDLVNHLINDIIVMGAQPLFVQDCIVCGKLEPDLVTEMVAALKQACAAQKCTLTGGETSEQPGVIEAGTYIFTASVIGVVDRKHVLDGSRIEPGDLIIGAASNGLHTNGYSLVRALLNRDPSLAERQVGHETFKSIIMRPHLCYRESLFSIYPDSDIVGAAHITGGGLRDNLSRVLPAGVQAQVDLSTISVPPVFSVIKEAAGVTDEEMLRTYNLGVGMTLVVKPGAAQRVMNAFSGAGVSTWQLGVVESGGEGVETTGRLIWC